MIVVGTDAPQPGETRVVIVDRRGFDRLALEVLCEHAGRVTVAASVATVPEAVRPLEPGGAVVLIGRQLLLADGRASISRLRAAGASRVILVGTGDRDRLEVEAMRIGADGVLARDADTVSQRRVLQDT